SPAALDLLTLAAHLGPEPIPLTLFTTHPDQLPGPLSAAARDPLAFTDLTQQLRRRALARVDPDTLQLHRLIAALLRARPPDQPTHRPLRTRLRAAFQRSQPGNQPDMPTRAVRLLRAAVPPDPWNNPPTWSEWRQLLPHVLTATDPSNPLDPAMDTLSWLLNCGATYLLTRGEPAAAQPLLERALGLDRAARGETHPSTLASVNNLAGALRALGHEDEANELEEWVRSRR
ncbi:MAG: tetratricopeptide repeat protein, partial [Pseudonocardiaceae bacterium]